VRGEEEGHTETDDEVFQGRDGTADRRLVEEAGRDAGGCDPERRHVGGNGMRPAAITFDGKKISEADLCAVFIGWASRDGWTAYAETHGWDIVLAKSGIQFGIQAKLRFTPTLLRQVMPVDDYGDVTGPHHRGILIPKLDSEIDIAMRACGVVAFSPYPRCGSFSPSLDAAIERGEWPTEKRLSLPDYVPDTIAGSSSPVQLTKWKISALRICAHIEIHGSITSKQIRQTYGVDARRWIGPFGWLLPKMDGEAIVGYVAGPKLKFAKQHPIVFEQIKSEMMAAQ
jgi:hypothetical protein